MDLLALKKQRLIWWTEWDDISREELSELVLKVLGFWQGLAGKKNKCMVRKMTEQKKILK